MSINYFYQAWNFHDLHFFVSYYEVYIFIPRAFFFFFLSLFWELWELCGKEVLPLIYDPFHGRAFSFQDWQSGTLHHSKMKPRSIKARMRHFRHGKSRPKSLRYKIHFSILSNGNRDEAVFSYQLTKNHPFPSLLSLLYNLLKKKKKASALQNWSWALSFRLILNWFL